MSQELDSQAMAHLQSDNWGKNTVIDQEKTWNIPPSPESSRKNSNVWQKKPTNLSGTDVWHSAVRQKANRAPNWDNSPAIDESIPSSCSSIESCSDRIGQQQHVKSVNNNNNNSDFMMSTWSAATTMHVNNKIEKNQPTGWDIDEDDNVDHTLNGDINGTSQIINRNGGDNHHLHNKPKMNRVANFDDGTSLWGDPHRVNKQVSRWEDSPNAKSTSNTNGISPTSPGILCHQVLQSHHHSQHTHQTASNISQPTHFKQNNCGNMTMEGLGYKGSNIPLSLTQINSSLSSISRSPSMNSQMMHQAASSSSQIQQQPPHHLQPQQLPPEQSQIPQSPQVPGSSQQTSAFVQQFRQSSGAVSQSKLEMQLFRLIQQIQLAVQNKKLDAQILNQPLSPSTIKLIYQLLHHMNILHDLEENAKSKQKDLETIIRISQQQAAIDKIRIQIADNQRSYLEPQQQQQQQQQNHQSQQLKHQFNRCSGNTHQTHRMSSPQGIDNSHGHLSSIAAAAAAQIAQQQQQQKNRSIDRAQLAQLIAAQSLFKNDYDNLHQQLTNDFTGLTMNDFGTSNGGGPQQQHNQSRLKTWKGLGQDDNSTGGDFSRAPGSSINGFRTNTASTSPSTAAALAAACGGNGGGINDSNLWHSFISNANDEVWSSADNCNFGLGATGSDGMKDATSPSDTLPFVYGHSFFNEFEPGKPWKGSRLKVEDDPYITPGSVAAACSPLSAAAAALRAFDENDSLWITKRP